MFRRFVQWLASAIGQVIIAAILGSAFLTAVVNAVVRWWKVLSWESSWVLWTGTAFGAYIGILKTAPSWSKWLPLPAKRANPNDYPPKPSLEMKERGREQQAKREQQIKSWRDMATMTHASLQVQQGSKTTHYTVLQLLEAEPRFLSLRPHLSKETNEALFTPNSYFSGGDASTFDPKLRLVLDDIDRLAKEWGVI